MPQELAKELKVLKEKELIEFIRRTVSQLDALADRLESYAETTTHPEVGFDTRVGLPSDPGE